MGAGYGGSYETGGALGEMVDLTTEVLGTLPVANGGTGAVTFTDNRVLTGTGTSAITAEANLLFTGTLLTALDTTQAVIGHTAAVTTGASNAFQVLGTGNADSRGLLARFSADAVGPDFDFLKSRHATIASNTIVLDDDVVGRLAWYPADGTNFATLAATFRAEVDDASPAAGDVGMAFVWSQMPGAAGAIAETMRLSAAGALFLANGAAAVVGHSASLTTGAADSFQVLGTAAADTRSLVGRFSADALGPDRDFLKSRHATLGSNTIVADDDVLGRLCYYPADGTNFATLAGVFQCEVDDASPAAGDVGVAFVWRGMRGAASAIADVMRLSAAGALSPGVSDATALGTTALMWSDLFLASGAVINFNNGNVTITQSTLALTIGGSAAGANLDFWVANASDTASSQARFIISTAGANAGDSLLIFETLGWNYWSIGTDNSDGDVFRIENAATLGGTSGLRLSSSALSPGGNDGVALGTTALQWSDLFLASGGVINFANGNITQTHGTNTLKWLGAAAVYTFSSDVARPFIITNAVASATALIQFSPNAVAKFSVGYNKPGSSDCFIIYDDVASAYRVILDGSGNLGIGATATFGTSAAGVVQMTSGTAPTTAPADTVTLYSTDDAAGNTIPSFFCEGTNVLATGQADSVSGTRVKIRVNGTVVTLLGI